MHLPVSGTYRVLVPTGVRPFVGTVRARTMQDLATSVPKDGSPVTLSSPSPGQWTIAHFDMSGAEAYALHVESAAASDGWSAFAEYEDRVFCDYDGPLGCGSDTHVQVDAAHLDSGPMLWLGTESGAGPRVLVLAMPPDGLGSVTLTLRPPSSTPRLSRPGLPSAG